MRWKKYISTDVIREIIRIPPNPPGQETRPPERREKMANSENHFIEISPPCPFFSVFCHPAYKIACNSMSKSVGYFIG
jgi:hypothetical protein